MYESHSSPCTFLSTELQGVSNHREGSICYPRQPDLPRNLGNLVRRAPFSICHLTGTSTKEKSACSRQMLLPPPQRDSLMCLCSSVSRRLGLFTVGFVSHTQSSSYAAKCVCEPLPRENRILFTRPPFHPIIPVSSSFFLSLSLPSLLPHVPHLCAAASSCLQLKLLSTQWVCRCQ